MLYVHGSWMNGIFSWGRFVCLFVCWNWEWFEHDGSGDSTTCFSFYRWPIALYSLFAIDWPDDYRCHMQVAIIRRERSMNWSGRSSEQPKAETRKRKTVGIVPCGWKQCRPPRAGGGTCRSGGGQYRAARSGRRSCRGPSECDCGCGSRYSLAWQRQSRPCRDPPEDKIQQHVYPRVESSGRGWRNKRERERERELKMERRAWTEEGGKRATLRWWYWIWRQARRTSATTAATTPQRRGGWCFMSSWAGPAESFGAGLGWAGLQGSGGRVLVLSRRWGRWRSVSAGERGRGRERGRRRGRSPCPQKLLALGAVAGRSVMSEMNPTLCQTAQTPKPLVRTVPTNNNVIIVCFSDIVFRFRGRKKKRESDHSLVTTICLSILAQVSMAISFSIPILNYYYLLSKIVFCMILCKWAEN